MNFNEKYAELTLKPNSKFDLDGLPKAVKQIGYTPGKIEVTVSGVLKDQGLRKALQWGNSGQIYLLLESDILEQLLSKSKTGDTVSVSGGHMLYKGKPYLWLNPEKRTKEKTASFEGKFVKSDEQLLFQVSESEKEGKYVVLENPEREQIESFLDDKNIKKDWKVSGVTTRYNGKDYLLIREYQLKR